MSDPFSHAASSIALSGAHNTRLYPHDDESLFFFFFWIAIFYKEFSAAFGNNAIRYVYLLSSDFCGENWDSEQLRNSSIHSRKVSLQNLCKVCMTTKHILLTT